MSSGVAAVSPNGVLGDPTGANAAEGAQLLQDMARRIVDRLTVAAR
jgi:mycofactocin precursor peptide peptidase